MPRIVDHEARREEIAEAAWRVIVREGPPGANMREIAREAGYTTGVITHYFQDKRELMAYAYELVVRRSTARMPAAITESGMIGALSQLLPLDEQRHRETTIWLALTTASLTDPDLARELRRRCQQIRDTLSSLASRTPLSPAASASRTQDRDDQANGERVDELLAIVDGITVDALADPQRYPPERQLALLRRATTRLGGED